MPKALIDFATRESAWTPGLRIYTLEVKKVSETVAALEELLVELQKKHDDSWDSDEQAQIAEQMEAIALQIEAESKITSNTVDALQPGYEADTATGECKPKKGKKDVTDENTPPGYRDIEVNTGKETAKIRVNDLTTLEGEPGKAYEYAKSVATDKEIAVTPASDLLMEYGRIKGLPEVVLLQLFDKCWDEKVGGRKTKDQKVPWRVLDRFKLEIEKAAVPSEDPYEQAEFVLNQRYGVNLMPLEDDQLEQAIKDDWDKAGLAYAQAKHELELLKTQYERNCALPLRIIEYVETVYLNHPAAEEFIERFAQGGKKFVDLPHVRLQSRKVPGQWVIDDEGKFKGFIDMLGAQTKEKLGITPYTAYRYDDVNVVKNHIASLPPDEQDKSGVRYRPEYKSVSFKAGKGDDE